MIPQFNMFITIEIKFCLQFIPNAFVLMLVLISAERKKPSFEALLKAFEVLDEKLKSTFTVSFALSNNKSERTSLLGCMSEINNFVMIVRN